MLSQIREKLIKSLHTKKGREKHKRCLVEGQKIIDEAGDYIDFEFTREISDNFDKLVTTETPQNIAAVANTPTWSLDDIRDFETILILDGIQDPGNVGTILRSCLGFDVGLILVESADPTSSKVIRSSAGATFKTRWIQIPRNEADNLIKKLGRDVYRLEKREQSLGIDQIKVGTKILIAGSEGSGIKLEAEGTSILINHSDKLESLNVATATAILLYSIYKN